MCFSFHFFRLVCEPASTVLAGDAAHTLMMKIIRNFLQLGREAAVGSFWRVGANQRRGCSRGEPGWGEEEEVVNVGTFSLTLYGS